MQYVIDLRQSPATDVRKRLGSCFSVTSTANEKPERGIEKRHCAVFDTIRLLEKAHIAFRYQANAIRMP